MLGSLSQKIIFGATLLLIGAGCSSINPPPNTPAPTPTTSEVGSNAVADAGKLHDLGWIAFSSQRDGNSEIYIMRPDGADVRRLTNDGSDDVEPALSPDGKRIAFASKRNGNYDIFVMNGDGSKIEQLTRDPADDLQPSWSPDGQRIAFASKRGGDHAVFVMGSDGSNVQPVTQVMTAYNPAWSPDGKRIAFWSNGIFLIDPAGKNPQKIADSAFPSSPPAWSPDNRKIAFAALFQGGSPEIDVLTLADKSRGRLKFGASGPTWSPDGAWIAYSSGGRLFVTDALAKSEVEISDDGREPSWGR